MQKRENISLRVESWLGAVPLAARVGDLLFSSDIYGWDVRMNQIPPDPVLQAEALFENIESLMRDAGGSLENVTYMMVCTRKDRHRDALAAFNKPWLKAFPDDNHRPARHAYQEEDLPVQDSLLRVNLIAVLSGGKRETIQFDDLTHTNPIPMGARHGRFVFSSTIFGAPSGTDSESKIYPRDPAEQAEIMFLNIRKFLDQIDGTPDDIVRLRLFIRRDQEQDVLLKAIDHEWIKMFPNEMDRPARPCIQEDFVPGGMLFRAEIMAIL
jgi:2-iminobutanoate/2-iminopropanoate deaminase